MTAEQMLGPIIVVIIMLLPTVLSVYNIVKKDKIRNIEREHSSYYRVKHYHAYT